MAQIPKGRLAKGASKYKPTCRYCAIYFSTTAQMGSYQLDSKPLLGKMVGKSPLPFHLERNCLAHTCNTKLIPRIEII